MSNEPITAHMMCMSCPRRAWGGRLGSWLVSDERWAAAGFKPTDVACRKCLEIYQIRGKYGWFHG